MLLLCHMGLYSFEFEEAPRLSAPRCVLFCRVLAVSPLAFEVEVPGRISAPIAHRLSAGGVSRARRGHEGGLFDVSTLTWKVKVEVEVTDCFSASIESRFCDDRSQAERLGDEASLWRRASDWGL